MISQFKDTYSYIYQAINDIEKVVTIKSIQDYVLDVESYGFNFVKKFIDFISIFEKLFFINPLTDFKQCNQDM